MAMIPTLEARHPSHRDFYTRFQREVMARAQRVTVICGAGISRKAGLRDFRSPDGLYRQSIGDGGVLAGSDLFATATLRDKDKLRAFGRLLTEMRITAREANLPDCHIWIERLHHHGRLVRCYTQNIDGLQTRDFDDMEDVVVELHGTNVYLKCHKCNQRPEEPASAFDQRLLAEGSVYCTRCSIRPGRTGSDMQLRERVPGLLLPEVLLNEDSSSPSKDGRSLGSMKEDDSHCDLLLILGTSLKSHGAAGLVRDLARLVHARGGMVIYLNLTSLSSSSWSSQVDLHIRVDVEEWANENLAHLQDVEAISLKSEIALMCTSIIECIKALPVVPEPEPELDAGTGSSIRAGPSITNEPLEGALERLHTSGPADLIAAGTTEQNDTGFGATGVMFVVCYHIWALYEAHALQVLLAKECSERGVQCSFHPCNVERTDQCPHVPPRWRTYRAVVIFVTRFAQLEKIRSSRSAGTRVDIFEVLSRSFALALPILREATWGVAIILGENEPWAQEQMLQSMSRIKSGLRTFPPTLAGFGTERLRLSGWANFIGSIVSSNTEKEEETIAELVFASWMATNDFYEHNDLKVWFESDQAYLLISAPFERRPLGRPLPSVHTAGCCGPHPEKEWVVSHDAAVNMKELCKIKATVECSQCGRTWPIHSDSLEGWIHYDNDKYAVQIPCRL